MTKELRYPQITHVAVNYSGDIYALPAPNRHHNVIRMIAKENGVGISGPDIKGFVDSLGYFLNRSEAYVLALQNGQLKRDSDPKLYQGKELYSEDLW